MEFYFWLSCCRCSCSLPEHCFTASVGKTWHADSMGPQCLFFLSVGVHHFLPGPQSHAHCLSSFLAYQTVSSYYKQLPPREESQGRAGLRVLASDRFHLSCAWLASPSPHNRAHTAAMQSDLGWTGLQNSHPLSIKLNKQICQEHLSASLLEGTQANFPFIFVKPSLYKWLWWLSQSAYYAV